MSLWESRTGVQHETGGGQEVIGELEAPSTGLLWEEGEGWDEGRGGAGLVVLLGVGLRGCVDGSVLFPAES